ncbi:unnamed protein product [Peniophora sp. CBMAI 1063]|nr:unnamed protein product [Peniophora sp. CBMAI 1063]
MTVFTTKPKSRARSNKTLKAKQTDLKRRQSHDLPSFRQPPASTAMIVFDLTLEHEMGDSTPRACTPSP